MKAAQPLWQGMAKSILKNTTEIGILRFGTAACGTIGIRRLQTTPDNSKSRTSKIPSVADYYRNKNVFITGGTGFMGKTIVEKLLRSCPDVGHIYMLVRGKDGKNPNHRLVDYFANPIFDTVKSQDLSRLKKVTAIQGDAMTTNLGIKESDRQMLKEKIHVFVNAAATVKFIEPIRTAADIHITSQLRSIDLAEEMKNLEAFLHMSSYGIAISGKNRYLNPGLQPLSISASDLMELLRTTDDATLKKMQQGDLLGYSKPFTYFFCKSISEHEISARAEKMGMPLAVICPAWVEPPAREPIPGWMNKDTTFLYTTLILDVGNGHVKAFHMDPKSGTHMIPGDIVANLTVASAWDLNYHPKHDQQWAHFYNMSSSHVHPLTIETLSRSIYRMFNKYPPKNPVGPVPQKWLYKSRPMYLYQTATKLWAPAIMKDLVSAITGKPRSGLKYAKEREYQAAVSAFICNFAATSTGDLSNWLSMSDRLSPEDRQIFWMDIHEVDWDKYCDDLILGMKKYLLEEI